MTTGPGTSGRDGGLNLQTAVNKLLPSPRPTHGEKAGPNMRGSSGDEMLPAVVHRLLPTPTVNDSRGGLIPTATRTNPDSKHHDGRTLTDVVFAMDLSAIDWREYEPAIRRWEEIHGQVPFPAALGPKGGVKPAPEFVEWMMALPSGHISSIPGLTINEMLKLLGNGVVPPQAEYAIRELTQGNGEVMSTNDTSSFFTTHQTRDVPRDQWGRYKLPGPDGSEQSWTRATTFAATLAEQYGLRIWKERQVVWGLSRRPDLMTLASTIAGPEDKKALGAIVDEAHIAAGTEGKANRGTAIHRACQASEQGAHELVPEELRPHVGNYLSTMRDAGLQTLPEYVERTIIVNQYGVAGTFDNLVRCPDGKIRVLDKKTGRLDYSDTEFAVQMALYAHGDAMFNYTTGRYEPLPEIATDYAILAHIDPVSGHCELQRVNIEWGWVWARTCAEVMDIRKTKHTITPYIPKMTDAAIVAQLNEELRTGQWVPGGPRGILGAGDTVTAGQFAAMPVTPISQPGPDARVVAVNNGVLGTVPGGIVDTTSPVPPEFQAFWSDDRHDYPELAEQVNGVPVAEYSTPNVHPCGRGEPCEFTGNEGLHVDGTVCLYGNARPGPIPPLSTHADLTAAAIEAQQPGATPESVMIAAGAPIAETHESGEPTVEAQDAAHSAESSFDDLVAKVDGHKGGKAAVQSIARRLMATLGIGPDDPGSIKLNQYKVKIARAIVTLATARGVPIPGAKDGDPNIGAPAGPAPTNSVSGPTAPKAPAERSGDEVTREAQIKTAVESIKMQGSIEGLGERHAYYTQTTIGWTDEMQSAARTRAAELDAISGATELSPMEMIQGATSHKTLADAWNKATNNGDDMSGWTEQLNAAAMAKQTELAGIAGSGN